MSSNKSVKNQMIKLYGRECFIDKLNLRKDDKPKRYKSKGQLKRMKQLTYHHIKERRNGGKTTIENGALLSAENHMWFNKQSKSEQNKMNKAFQEYKLQIALLQGTGEVKEPQIIEIDMSDCVEIEVFDYNARTKKVPKTRAKLKSEMEDLRQEFVDR